MRAFLAVIGAHPMDAEILGGAIAAELTRRNCASILVHLTNGAGSYSHLGRIRSAELSRREAAQAAQILGTQLHWCDFDSRAISPQGHFLDALAELLHEWQPEVVITHWRGSWHERHTITHQLVANALAAARLTPALYYGENFEDLAGFIPSVYTDISDVCARWWQALESYALVRASHPAQAVTQGTFPYCAYYRAAPRVRGLESGLSHAQALATGGVMPPRPLVVDDPLQLSKERG